MEPGTVIDGKYRILRLLGEGGMGAVYEGENVRIHRKVAIKVLHSAVASNAEAVQRFEREAQAAGRIGSSHIVEVLDLGDLPSGDRFMVMEYLDGETLSGRVKSLGRLSPQQLFPIATQILDALAAAHGAGIIHRDIKPDNVFLVGGRKGEKDFVKLLDFGISKFSAMSGEAGFTMTRTGAVMGTPYYLSPEQAKGAKDVDARADLYAIGVILYECVTGRVPFEAETFNGLIMKIAFEVPAPPEQLSPDVDPAFGSIISKAMAREPDERFATAEAFNVALKSWAETGARVTIPPTGGLDMGSAPGPGGTRPLGATKAGANTSGAWATRSSPGASSAEQSAAAGLSPKVLIGATAAALLVAVVVVAFLFMRPAPPAAAAAPGAVAASAPVAAAPLPQAPVVTAAPSVSATADPSPNSAAAVGAGDAPSAHMDPAKPLATRTAPRTASPVARPAAAPAAAAARPPAAAPGTAAMSAGRRIHTDF
jgi:serine/threonine-protein kinase